MHFASVRQAPAGAGLRSSSLDRAYSDQQALIVDDQVETPSMITSRPISAATPQDGRRSSRLSIGLLAEMLASLPEDSARGPHSADTPW